MDIIFQTVAKELARLNMSMPIQIDDEVLNEKAIILADELSSWSPETITHAFREHGRSSRFMPTISEILSLCRSASQSLEYRRQKQNALPMPDHLPEEVRQNNLLRIDMLKKRIGMANAMPDKVKHAEKVKRQAAEILRKV